MRTSTADPSVTPRRWLTLAAALLAAAGCHHRRVARTYDAPPLGPPPVAVVTSAYPPSLAKPLPPHDGGLPPAYADPAIVRQQLPEEPRFVQAYGNIGRPKLLVFVNRTVTGELVPVNPHVTVRTGPSDRTTYLHPGQYDEAEARSIDYELIENLLTDDLSADGKVVVIAPMAARQRLGEAEVRDVQAGRPQMLGEMATQLNADVLVQVTARPSRQTDQGLGIRLVAEALNTHGGQAIAFADVDVPPPLTKPQLNEFVRFVARKLMDGMSASWEDMGSAAGSPARVAAPVPTPPPTPLPAVQQTPAPPLPPQSSMPSMVPATPPGSPSTRPTSANPLDLPSPP